MKKIILLLFLSLLFTSCKKFSEGYLSPIIRYDVSPVVIQQGRSFTSSPVVSDFSTRPLKFTLAKVYNRVTGEDMTTVFKQKYPLKIWKSYYDLAIDSTLEQVNAKRLDSLVCPIVINPVSGQIEANYNSKYLPLGKYNFDLEIENAGNKKYYPNIGQFDLVEAPTYELPIDLIATAVQVGNEDFELPIYIGNNIINVQYIDNSENLITLKFLDKEGNTFNPKTEIQFRPNFGEGGRYLQSLIDYAFQSTYYDDRIEFTYGVIPFPFYSLGPGYIYFYRIPAASVDYDSDLGLPYNFFSCNIFFAFRAFAYGTYQVEVTLPNVTRVP